MTKFLILLTALAASASTSFAQAPARAAQTAVDPAGQPKSPDQQAERRAQYLTKELGLTPDQQARLTPILLAQRQEMQALRSQVQTGGRRGMGQDLKASQTQYDTQIKAVLTPEQYAKFGQLKAEQRDKLRERRASGQGLKRPE